MVKMTPQVGMEFLWCGARVRLLDALRSNGPWRGVYVSGGATGLWYADMLSGDDAQPLGTSEYLRGLEAALEILDGPGSWEAAHEAIRALIEEEKSRG